MIGRLGRAATAMPRLPPRPKATPKAAQTPALPRCTRAVWAPSTSIAPMKTFATPITITPAHTH